MKTQFYKRQKKLEEEERKKKLAAAEKAAAAENLRKTSENNQLDINNAKVRRASRFEVKTLITPPDIEVTEPNQDDTSTKSPGNGVPLASKEDTSLSPDSKEGSLEPGKPEDFNESRRPSFLDSLGVDPNSPAMKALIQLSTKPKKSILKKTNSFTIHGLTSNSVRPNITDESVFKKRFHTLSPNQASNYKTVTGAEAPSWKRTFDHLGAMFKKPSTPDIGHSNVSAMAMAASKLFYIV